MRVLMNKASQAASTATVESKPKVSLYEQVQRDEHSRDVYLNTTQAILTANPDLPETDEICQKLRNSSVAWIFTPNNRLPRPILRSHTMTLVGKTDILEAIGDLDSTEA